MCVTGRRAQGGEARKENLLELVNYALITIKIRSELPLREAWRLTMIEW